MDSGSGLVSITRQPPNAETPLHALAADLTPTPLFYVRCNFPVPETDAATWSIGIEGHVRNALSVSLAELADMPQHEVTTTLECAGNGRRLMEPRPPGTPWGVGAVSTGRFTGVLLRDVLQRAGLADDVFEIVFEGADIGATENGTYTRFARSLPLSRALQDDTLIAWTLNGAPLALEHGYPVRLVVPGYYGVASVKWLTRIIAVTTPFVGHFQTDRYVYVGHPDYPSPTPVTLMRVRALITAPAADALIAGPDVAIRGVAWSGHGAIRRVSVSTDDGGTWNDAPIVARGGKHVAVRWEYVWRDAREGGHVIVARAEDDSGRIQPLHPLWNELGYGNNVVHRVAVTVGSGASVGADRQVRY